MRQFYRFTRLHLFPLAEHHVEVYAASYAEARAEAKKITGGGFLLFFRGASDV